MLDILRKKASSWITKTFLILIVIVFIFFFGWSSFREARESALVVASVNGDPIYQTEINQIVQNQMDFYQQIYKGELPPTLQKQFQESAFQSLVEDRITRATAKTMGFRVVDDEIYNQIIADPNLQVNGNFDAKRYQEVFRPWFFNRVGIDYEEMLRRKELTDSFHELFNKAVILSDEQAQYQYRLNNTKIALDTIELTPLLLAHDYKPEEPELEKRLQEKKTEDLENPEQLQNLKAQIAKEMVLDEGTKRLEAALKEIEPLFKSGKSVEAVLKKYNLKKKEIPLTSLSQGDNLFSGKSTPESLTVVYKLNPKNPYPDQPIRINNSAYLVKLTKKEAPSWEEFEKTKKELKEKLVQDTANQFFEVWYANALNNSKIKVSSPESEK